jgi:predicted transport protein
MDQAATMIENLKKNTGKSLEEWIAIVSNEDLEKHGQIIKFLKEEHAFTHGFANLVAHKTLKSDSGSIENKDDMVTTQYKGKEHFRPLYDQLTGEVLKFGKDVEIDPKKSYVSLKRKKQFAMLKPATKKRFEIGLNLKSVDSGGMVEKVTAKHAMFSHMIKLSDEDKISDEVVNWIKKAYELAG